MGKGRLEQKLSSYPKVFLDTSIFIYFFEENEQWLDLVIPVFELAEKKELKLTTSSVTVLEIITGFKKEGTREDIEKFWDMLQEFGIEILDFKKEQVELAAQLRADYGFRTPDAIQLSLAIDQGIPALVTNDKKLTAVKETEVIYLGDYRSNE